MADAITLEALLKAGVHFGHKESKRHPKMQPFLFGVRNSINVIDLEQTIIQLESACDAAREMAKDGKAILFVGTKDAVAQIVREEAKRVGMPYVVGRWLGGTLTNFSVISKLIQKYRGLVRSRDTGELEQKYTKHEQSERMREIARLEEAVGGIAELNKLPDALFVVDIREESTAVREAIRKGIPTFAICDSNVNPEHITYPVSGNDDAVSSVKLIVQLFTDAVQEGIDARARTDAATQAARAQKEESDAKAKVVEKESVQAE
ncbi:MAG: 30S ribosomal protein S2 [Candidatus Uhrbacteria bacterium]